MHMPIKNGLQDSIGRHMMQVDYATYDELKEIVSKFASPYLVDRTVETMIQNGVLVYCGFYKNYSLCQEWQQHYSNKPILENVVPPRFVQLLQCKEWVPPKPIQRRLGSEDYKTWPSKGGD